MKNIVTVSGGIIFAQALPFLFYPIFSRIYLPSDFGILAIITSITPILTILSTGMYESAILLSNSKEESANIVGLVIRRSIFFFIISLLFFYFFAKDLGLIINQKEAAEYFIYIPIIVFCTALFNVFNEWAVTYKYFKSLAINKITSTSSISIGKLFFGLVKIPLNGLILGEAIGKLFTAILCIRQALRYDKFYFFKINKNAYKSIKNKYKEFPKIIVADQVLNNLSGAIHIFFIAKFFGNDELGLVSLGMSLLTVPVTVISAAIKDVFRQRAKLDYTQFGSCKPLYLKLLKPIFILGLFFFSLLYFVLPFGVKFFLGIEWIKTAFYCQLLVPMFFLNFVSMSLGGVLLISKKNHISLAWQVLTIFLSSISFYIAHFISNEISLSLILFSIARSISYGSYIIISLHYSENSTYLLNSASK